ncbi:OB-fold protein [Legionella antarctica]|uniref:OB-fold protein n=1 Tax=Legionella antarctica TaxID=2708020 RepID=UPI0015642417|nr:hypothetical protein [Legionella antarctica]
MIDSVGKDLLGTAYVTLKTPNTLFTIQCMFNKSSEGQLGSLQKGQQISVVGKVSGKLGNVILNDCSF